MLVERGDFVGTSEDESGGTPPVWGGVDDSTPLFGMDECGWWDQRECGGPGGRATAARCCAPPGGGLPRHARRPAQSVSAWKEGECGDALETLHAFLPPGAQFDEEVENE